MVNTGVLDDWISQAIKCAESEYMIPTEARLASLCNSLYIYLY